jgi:ribonuclease HI
MLVTITTDASYYKQYKIGAFAFWISSDKGRVTIAAPFKNVVESSHDAEFKCIINSLHSLHKQKWDVKEIYINTDSQTVIGTIEGTANKLPEYGKENLKAYKAIIKQLNVTHVSLRHVKGHKHTKTARHWVNNWCDVNAKKNAKNKIKELFGDVLK